MGDVIDLAGRSPNKAPWMRPSCEIGKAVERAMTDMATGNNLPMGDAFLAQLWTEGYKVVPVDDGAMQPSGDGE